MEMKKDQIDLIIFITSIVIKYGPTTVKRLIDMLNKDVITKDDLVSILLEKDPEEFFKKNE